MSRKIRRDSLKNQTETEFDAVIAQCREIFLKKNQDYGQSWRIMRISSIIDQIYIKAVRIRTIEEKGANLVGESVEDEYRGIINYCVMALIQLETNEDERFECDEKDLLNTYDKFIVETRSLLLKKNHDYGEIWRNMLVSTFTDMLLMRINRMHQIIANKGKTTVSEGIESNLMDMINYSVFALIHLNKKIQ
ncbi:MAG: DUF1599 domain-containing protein [Bacteroidetes bacterium]|nr:DUF1599 domain-containing protein [Bacteroidota bacterium]MCK6609398.1 DUF1599 domain-containing protein [Bacteroidia bacterium]